MMMNIGSVYYDSYPLYTDLYSENICGSINDKNLVFYHNILSVDICWHKNFFLLEYNYTTMMFVPQYY